MSFHHHLISSFASLVIAATGAVCSANETDPPQLVPIDLKEQRWQPLPDRVVGVFSEPGGRAWFRVEFSRQLSIAEMKALVERTFDMPRPQVAGFVPVLFEPKQANGKPGRVWFAYHPAFYAWHPLVGGGTVFGYAGEPGKWIERESKAKGFYFRGPSDRRALMIGNTRFFYEHNGLRDAFGGADLIHVFDGSDWSIHEIKVQHRFRPATLFAEPDGKGLIVPIPDTNPPELWRWREGIWQEHVMPELEEYGPSCIGCGGMWMGIIHGGVGFSAYPTKDETPPKLVCVPRFGPYNYRGLWFLESLPDGHVLLGAREVWKDGEEDDPRLVKARQILMGMVEIINTTFRHTAETIRMQQEIFDLCGGVIALNPDGTYQLIRGARVLGGWHRATFARESGPILAPRGLWTTGDHADYPPGLLDFEKGKIVDELPDPRATFLHAVGDDGTVYASDHDMCSPTIMAYRPQARDNVITVRPDDRFTLATKLDRCWTREDGSVWARGLTGGMVRFDGHSWQPIPQLAGISLEFAVSGKEKTLLGRTDGGEWVLMQQDFVAKSRNLLELIHQNRPRVMAGFRGPQHRGSVDLRLCVAADAKGHIWVSATGIDGVQVLVGDRWQSLPQSLSDPNSPLEAVVIASLGDRVYINGQTASSSGAPAFLARVEDGEIVLDEQDQLLRTLSLERVNIWHDLAGGLWLPTFARGRDGSSRDAVYLTAGGEQQRYRMGRPVLVRENGEVWFTSMEENEWKYPVMHIWRDGRIRQTLQVPGLAASEDLFSTKTNVVWAFTGGGIRRLINQGTFGEVKYEIDDKVYVLRDARFDATSERIRQIAYSSLGYFFTVCTDRDSKTAHRLQLIPVPNDGGEQAKGTASVDVQADR